MIGRPAGSPSLAPAATPVAGWAAASQAAAAGVSAAAARRAPGNNPTRARRYEHLFQMRRSLLVAPGRWDHRARRRPRPCARLVPSGSCTKLLRRSSRRSDPERRHLRHFANPSLSHKSGVWCKTVTNTGSTRNSGPRRRSRSTQDRRWWPLYRGAFQRPDRCVQSFRSGQELQSRRL